LGQNTFTTDATSAIRVVGRTGTPGGKPGDGATSAITDATSAITVPPAQPQCHQNNKIHKDSRSSGQTMLSPRAQGKYCLAGVPALFGRSTGVVWPDYRRCLAGSNVLQEDLPAMPVDGPLAAEFRVSITR